MWYDGIDEVEPQTEAHTEIQSEHVALALLIGKGRSIWGRNGQGMVDPGTQVEIFVVPRESVTEEGMADLESAANNICLSIEALDMPAHFCDSMEEVLKLLRPDRE